MCRPMRYLAALLLGAGQVLAGPPVAWPRTTPLHETFHEEAPVSGRVVTGLMLAGSGGSARLALLPPAAVAGGSVCVQVVSRDGRYWAENTFVLPPAVGGQPVLLAYPSAHRDLLRTLGEDELALLAYQGECGRRGGRQLLLSARSPADTPPGRVWIFVNSGRTDTYVQVKNDAGARRPSRCRRIRQGRRTAFDTVCTVELPKPEAVAGPLEVRILRRRYERMLPPTELVIALPGEAG